MGFPWKILGPIPGGHWYSGGEVTDKPDALEELKRLRTEIQQDADFLRAGRNTAGPQDCYVRDLDAAIAAWEKERAAARDLLAVIHRDGGHHTAEVGFTQSCRDAQQIRHDLVMHLDALRTAVETVRDELREASQAEDGIVSALTTDRLADALDAALRGGA